MVLILKKNVRKQFNLRYHSSNVELGVGQTEILLDLSTMYCFEALYAIPKEWQILSVAERTLTQQLWYVVLKAP